MNLMSPQLQAFMAVVETKTVHAAAVILNLTQTAVTQRIKTLETQLKTTLFIRSRRGMELTTEGTALLRYCQSVKILEGEALAKISGTDLVSEFPIRISGSSSIMRTRVIPGLLTINRQFPNLLLHFKFDDTDNLQQHLKSGECDLAIMTKEQVTKEMTFKPLKSERYKLVCSKLWKNRLLEDILVNERIVDFNPSDQLTWQYLQHFNLLSFVQKQRHFVNNSDSMAELVIAGAGYTILTEEVAEKYLEADKLIVLNGDRVFEFMPVLAWYPRVEMPGYFAEIIRRIN